MGFLDLGEKRREPGECVIKVGSSEEEIIDFYPFLLEVTVETSRDKASVALLKLESIRDETGHWAVQDADVFKPWTPVTIEAAFGSDKEEVFRGFIREIKVEHPEDSAIAQVSVQCQDVTLEMDRNHIRKSWGEDAPTTDAAIVTEILQKYGISLHKDSGEGLANLVLNQDETDIKFLLKRAEANGYELIVQEGEAYFGLLRTAEDPQDPLMLYAGRMSNCSRMDIQVDAHQPDRVIVNRAEEEGTSTEEIEVESDLKLMGTTEATGQGEGLEDFVWRMSRQSGATEEEIRARAQKKANELSLRVKAEGELDGTLYGHVLRVGLPVTVDGVGPWLGGRYYVDECKHTFDPDGYRQSFKLLRNAFGEDGAGVQVSDIAGAL